MFTSYHIYYSVTRNGHCLFSNEDKKVLKLYAHTNEVLYLLIQTGIPKPAMNCYNKSSVLIITILALIANSGFVQHVIEH